MSSEEEAGRKAKVNETGRRNREPSDEDLEEIRRNVGMEEEERRRAKAEGRESRDSGKSTLRGARQSEEDEASARSIYGE